MDRDLPRASQNGSSGIVIEDDAKHGGADLDADGNGGRDINLIELGLCFGSAEHPRRSNSMTGDTDMKTCEEEAA